MASTPARKIFISYAHLDKRWFDEAKTHLAPLIDAGLLEAWTDERIPVGGDWRMEIEKALDSADVGLLLVTPNFLARPFVTKTELPALLAKRLFWVPVSACNFHVTPLAKAQAAHDAGKPLDTLTKPKRNQAWVEISKKLQAALADPK